MPLKHTAKEIVTDQGVHGLLIHVPDAPVLHYEVFFHGGYHGVTKGQPQQTAHVLEHMVFSNTADNRYKTKDAYMNDVLKNGAIANATTYYAGLWYYADCDVEEWRRMVGLHRLALENPLLTQVALEAELGNAAGEMKRNVNEYPRVSRELARGALGLDTLTSEEHISSFKDVTLSGVREHYARTHTLANMRFIVTGDVAATEADVVGAFSGWNLEEGVYDESEPLTLKKGGGYAYKHVGEVPSVYVDLAVAMPRRLSPVEARTFDVINSYLFNTLNSKVLGEARQKGYAYELHGMTDQDIEKMTVWHIWAPIPKENVQAVLGLIFDALRAIVSEGIPEERFDYVKTFTIGRTKQYGQTVAGLNQLYSDSFTTGGTIVSYEDVDRLFDTVTRQSARTLVQEILGAGCWVLAGVGSVGKATFEDHYKKCAAFFEEIQ